MQLAALYFQRGPPGPVMSCSGKTGLRWTAGKSSCRCTAGVSRQTAWKGGNLLHHFLAFALLAADFVGISNWWNKGFKYCLALFTSIFIYRHLVFLLLSWFSRPGRMNISTGFSLVKPFCFTESESLCRTFYYGERCFKNTPKRIRAICILGALSRQFVKPACFFIQLPLKKPAGLFRITGLLMFEKHLISQNA